MEKVKKISAIEQQIKFMENNNCAVEIIDVSEVELLSGEPRECVSLVQGAYPIEIWFTPMQKVTLTYLNKYFGVCKCVIIAGSDAIKYTRAETPMYEGYYLSEHLIDVEYIGEYAFIKSYR